MKGDKIHYVVEVVPYDDVRTVEEKIEATDSLLGGLPRVVRNVLMKKPK